MNYFFFCKKKGLSSKIEVPKFRNDGVFDSGIRLFCASISRGSWRIEQVSCSEDEHFFCVEADTKNCNSIFFLAKPSDVGGVSIDAEELKNYNSFTSTVPDFRANLSVSNELGGFSSYQSEYPFDMTLRRGALISSISSLGNLDAEANYIFVRNIFHKPIKEKYPAFLVCKKSKKIKKQFELRTNETCLLNLEIKDITPECYLVTKGFIGIPIYYSEDKRGHLSLEHTHPPHSNIDGVTRFKKVTKLKNELLEIIG